MRLIVCICGFIMGTCDAIPGVSGGTIAFVLGIYDEMLSSIKNVLKFDLKRYKFLIQLGLFWLIGLLITNTIVVNLLDAKIYELSSLFLGIILFSIPLTIKMDKDLMKNNLRYLYLSLIGFLIVIIITYFSNYNVGINFVELNNLTPPQYIYVFICGMLAAACMLLPGISGSIVMIVLGLYYPLQEAIYAFVRMDFSYVGFLMAIGFGILFGLLVSAKIILFIFEKFKVQTLFLIQGLLIGSLYSIIMGPMSLGYEKMSIVNISIIAVILGCLLMFGLEKIRVWSDKRDNENNKKINS